MDEHGYTDRAKCTACEHWVDRLEIFPGGICLECYRQTDDARRPITTDELTAMWGGPVRRQS